MTQYIKLERYSPGEWREMIFSILQDGRWHSAKSIANQLSFKVSHQRAMRRFSQWHQKLPRRTDRGFREWKAKDLILRVRKGQRLIVISILTGYAGEGVLDRRGSQGESKEYRIPPPLLEQYLSQKSNGENNNAQSSKKAVQKG